MLTLKIENVNDIKNALLRVDRLPRGQRIDVLEHARRKLLAIRRRGTNPELQQLYMSISRKLTDEKRRMDKKPTPKPKVEVEEEVVRPVDKNISELEPGEFTEGTGRYDGLLVGRDDEGFFAKGPEGRTPSYSWSGKISSEELGKIGPHEDISG